MFFYHLLLVDQKSVFRQSYHYVLSFINQDYCSQNTHLLLNYQFFYWYTENPLKVFCRSSESSYFWKETVDKYILVTSRNGDRKIIQSIRITSRYLSGIRKRSQLSQFTWTSTSSNTYRKDLSWLYFDNESMAQREASGEGSRVLHIRFCSLSSNFKKQIGAPAKTWLQLLQDKYLTRLTKIFVEIIFSCFP